MNKTMKKKRLDASGVSAFCESMALMIRSGIQVDEAIELLQQESTDKEKTKGILTRGLEIMKESTEAGLGLAQAMKDAGIFPEYCLHMVRAGESTGRLDDILFHLAKYYSNQRIIIDKMTGAVSYPLAMLVLILAVLIVMVTMVLPVFSGVYNDMTGSLSASTYSYLNLAYSFCWIALGIIMVLTVVLMVGVILWSTKYRTVVLKVLNHVPAAAAILEKLAMFRFTNALATFLASGMMQDEAVLESTVMADHAPIEAKLKACSLQMEEGHSFAQTAFDARLFEPVYGRMLLAGERSGDSEAVLDELAKGLEEECLTRVDRIVNVIDPLLSGILMVTIGVSLLSVMLPLIGMMNSIG